MDAIVCMPEFHFPTKIQNGFHDHRWINWVNRDGSHLGQWFLGVFDRVAY